jgi:hypothetical protein
MLVCPDSSDLIRLERDDGQLVEELGVWLGSLGARLVLSATVIAEVAQPLDAAPAARVMLLMNRLAALPHVWFRSIDAEKRELEMAIRCYADGLPWAPVAPFVETYIDTFEMLPFARRFYRGRSLAEIVWDQLSQDRLRPSKTVFENWLAENRAAISATDDVGYQRQLRIAFGRAVASYVPESAEGFVEHLWARPDWCPAARLSFEAAQLFQADTTTRGRSSDIEDLVRIKAVPYVDLFVADASKRSYLNTLKAGKRNSRLRECGYWTRCTIVGSLDEARHTIKAR